MKVCTQESVEEGFYVAESNKINNVIKCKDCISGGVKNEIKYLSLLASLIVLGIVGVIIHIENIKAEEYSKFDGSLQAAYAAVNLDIINTLYFPILLLTHFILFMIFKYKDSKKSIVD